MDERRSLATSASATARARPMPAIRRIPAGASSTSRKARPARPSSATATASSIPPPSAASSTRRRSSSRMRATTTAPGSPTRSRSRRSPARWRGRCAATKTSPRPSRWSTISATRRSATPARMRSNAKMAKWGGFDHNAQSLRVVTRLERRYAEFDGLNLTWETLEGLVKHNGPLTDADGKGLKGPVPQAIRDFSELLRPRARQICRARSAMRGDRRRHRLQHARHR